MLKSLGRSKYVKLAIDRGAKIIEKHFTFRINAPGWDHGGSATPLMMKEIVDYANSK